MPRHGTAVVGFALALALLPAPAADARVAASARLVTDGTTTTLVVTNLGDETIQCLRFNAADGVEVVTAQGPGTTQAIPPRGFAAQNFAVAPSGQDRWVFTTSEPYPSGAGGALVVSSTCQPGSDVAAPVSGPGAEPVLGRVEVAAVVSGIVRVRRRGTRRFVRLRDERALPDGSEIDTRRGVVRITVANGRGGTESAEVSQGRAIVDQNTAPRPTTTLRLSEPLACPRRGRGATAAARRRKRRRLFTRTAGGRFRTRGRHAAAVATGTAWRTTDTCGRTDVDVREGTVRVTARSGRSVNARAGQRVVALPPRRRG